MRIAMLGAGSVVFSKTLTGDLLSFPELRDATITYMDVDRERLDVAAGLCRRIARGLGASPTIRTTLDRREALAGGDVVFVFVQVGGFDHTLVDFEIPRKYGLRFTIADTTGPGGLMRALRSYPFYRDLARDCADVCPNAWVLNYTNPMGMNLLSLGDHPRSVGLCHSVQKTFELLLHYLDESTDGAAFECAGINHLSFFTSLTKGGVDLYPRLFELLDDPRVYSTNKVRFELMRRLGHFVTESSEHSAEYSPWFLAHGDAVAQRFGVPVDEYLRRCDGIVDEYNRLKEQSTSDEPLPHAPSPEYGSLIAHSLFAGTPRVVYTNQPNTRGQIPNLPRSAIVELPTDVDASGATQRLIAPLPSPLVGYMLPHVTQQQLFIEAVREGRRDRLYQAAMFDPLTSAQLTPDKIVEMIDELIAAHGALMPKLDKRTLVPGSGRSFEPPTPQALRASWDAAQAQSTKDTIDAWRVLASDASEPGALDWSLAIDASRCCRGFVDLRCATRGEIAFARATVASLSMRDVTLRLASDGPFTLWLNGEEIACHLGQRRINFGIEVPAKLLAGENHLIARVEPGPRGWRFGAMVPRALF